MEVIWVGCEGIYFCRQHWTTQITLIQLDKIVFRRKAVCGAMYAVRRSSAGWPADAGDSCRADA
jgi:hypothetical protein